MLRLTLLGTPKIMLRQSEPTLPRKALALITYLALEGSTPRAKLAEMLWCDADQEGSRSNLRQLLHHIGKTPLDTHIASDGKCLSLLGDCLSDVGQYRQAIAQQQWSEALRLYRGDFLEGLDLSEADGFEEWLHEQREELQGLYAQALEQQALQLESKGDLSGALKGFLELLRRDELQERYHRQAMRLHAAMGEREAALRQFARCQAVLQQELGLKPLPETFQLAEQIRLCNLAPVEISTANSVSVLELLMQGFASPMEMVEYLEQLCQSFRQQLNEPSTVLDNLLPPASRLPLPAASTTSPAASSSKPVLHRLAAIPARKTLAHLASRTR